MDKYKKQSIVIWCLFVVMAISTVGTPIFDSFDLRNQYKEGIDIF
jgi:hypothetical protein